MPRWFLVLELALSGCSFTLSAPASHRPRNQPPACDSGKGMVVADALIATGLGLAGIGEAANNSGNAAVIPFALSAAFIGAALYGNSITTKCQAEMNDYRMAQAGDAVVPDLTVSRPVDVSPPVAVVAPHVVPTYAAPAPTPAPAVVTAPRPTPTVAPAPHPTPAPRPAPTVDDPWAAFWQVLP